MGDIPNAAGDAEQRKNIVVDTRDRLAVIESLADTPFGGLFHAARTARTYHSSAVVQVRVRDGAIETSDPVMQRSGESLRGTDAWDGMISLPTEAFMTVRSARSQISHQLRDLQQTYGREAQRAREAERRASTSR